MRDELDEHLKHFGVSSPYELATSDNLDPRSDIHILSDVVDREIPEIFDLKRRLGLFETEDSTTFDLKTVLDIVDESVYTGTKLEKNHPGKMERVVRQDYPHEIAEVQASRETSGSHE